MSLTVEERKERENRLFPGIEKYLSFSMTARVAGSTHSVLLAINVILVKECEESLLSCSTGTFLQQL